MYIVHHLCNSVEIMKLYSFQLDSVGFFATCKFSHAAFVNIERSFLSIKETAEVQNHWNCGGNV